MVNRCHVIQPQRNVELWDTSPTTWHAAPHLCYGGTWINSRITCNAISPLSKWSFVEFLFVMSDAATTANKTVKQTQMHSHLANTLPTPCTFQIRSQNSFYYNFLHFFFFFFFTSKQMNRYRNRWIDATLQNFSCKKALKLIQSVAYRFLALAIERCFICRRETTKKMATINSPMTNDVTTVTSFWHLAHQNSFTENLPVQMYQ